MSAQTPSPVSGDADPHDVGEEIRDISDVPAVEVINTVAVHLLSAAAVKVGLADDPDQQLDLDEARKLIDALAGLVTAAARDRDVRSARARCCGLRPARSTVVLRTPS